MKHLIATVFAAVVFSVLAADNTVISANATLKDGSTYTCRTVEELVEALEDSKKQESSCLFDLKVLPKTMTEGYEAWWNIGIATTSEKESVRKACEDVMEHRDAARRY